MTVNQQNFGLRFNANPCDGVIVCRIAVRLRISRVEARLERGQSPFRWCDLVIERLTSRRQLDRLGLERLPVARECQCTLHRAIILIVENDLEF